MEDQELNSEVQEVVTQETEPNESIEQTNTIQEQSQEQSEREIAQEKNWRAMRQRQKELETRLQEKERILETVLSMQKPQTAPAVEEAPFDPDDFANYSGVQKMTKRTVQPLESKIQELEARIARQDQEKLFSSLKSKYPDFDDVVNIETLEILEQNEPELAATIAEFKDPYKMGIQSYKYIKALNLAEKLPNSRRKKEIDQKIEKNSKSVQSPLAYDKRPVAQAFKTSAAEKTRLYEEMMHFASQATGL